MFLTALWDKEEVELCIVSPKLADMQGSGKVRDLRQAASMTTAEGATLLGTLDQFATTTRAADNDELTLKVAA